MEENTTKKKKWLIMLIIAVIIVAILLGALLFKSAKEEKELNLYFIEHYSDEIGSIDGVKDAWGEVNDDGTYTVYMIIVKDYIRYKCSYTYETITDEQTMENVTDINRYEWEAIGAETGEYLNDVNDLANNIVDQAGQLIGQ